MGVNGNAGKTFMVFVRLRVGKLWARWCAKDRSSLKWFGLPPLPSGRTELILVTAHITLVASNGVLLKARAN